MSSETTKELKDVFEYSLQTNTGSEFYGYVIPRGRDNYKVGDKVSFECKDGSFNGEIAELRIMVIGHLKI